MTNYLAAKKMATEARELIERKQKNYCFILAESQEDEAMQIWEHKEPNTTFIIARKDRWRKKDCLIA